MAFKFSREQLHSRLLGTIVILSMSGASLSFCNRPHAEKYPIADPNAYLHHFPWLTVTTMILTNDLGTGGTINSAYFDGIGMGQSNEAFHLVCKQPLASHSSYTFPQQIYGDPTNIYSDSFISAVMGPWGPNCIIQIFQGSSPDFHQDKMVYDDGTVSPSTNGSFSVSATMAIPEPLAAYTIVVLEPQV